MLIARLILHLHHLDQRKYLAILKNELLRLESRSYLLLLKMSTSVIGLDRWGLVIKMLSEELSRWLDSCAKILSVMTLSFSRRVQMGS